MHSGKQRWFACDKNKDNSFTSIGSRLFFVSSVDFKRFDMSSVLNLDLLIQQRGNSPQAHFISFALLCLHTETHVYRGMRGERCRSLRKRKWFWSTSTLLLSNAGISPKYAPVKLGTLSQTYTGKHMSQVCTSLCHSALFRPASRLLGNSWGCLLTAFT